MNTYVTRAVVGFVVMLSVGSASFSLSWASDFAHRCLPITRSQTVLRQFQHLYPCPSTGKKTGACPGWVKDHRIGLCCGGKDEIANLQWQTITDARAKDKWECNSCPRCHRDVEVRRPIERSSM